MNTCSLIEWPAVWILAVHSIAHLPHTLGLVFITQDFRGRVNIVPSAFPFLPHDEENLWDVGPRQPQQASLPFSVGTLGSHTIPKVWKSKEGTQIINSSPITLRLFLREYSWW